MIAPTAGQPERGSKGPKSEPEEKKPAKRNAFELLMMSQRTPRRADSTPSSKSATTAVAAAEESARKTPRVKVRPKRVGATPTPKTKSREAEDERPLRSRSPSPLEVLYLSTPCQQRAKRDVVEDGIIGMKVRSPHSTTPLSTSMSQ